MGSDYASTPAIMQRQEWTITKLRRRINRLRAALREVGSDTAKSALKADDKDAKLSYYG